MSDKVETFKTDIGEVSIDMKKKTVTVGGKPLHDVVSEKTAMELLIKDLAIDRELLSTLKTNSTNLKSWLPGIGNRQARDIFRKYLEDLDQVLKAMIQQKNLQMITLVKMEAKWTQQQHVKPASVVESSATDATAPSDAVDRPAPDAPLSQPEFQ